MENAQVDFLRSLRVWSGHFLSLILKDKWKKQDIQLKRSSSPVITFSSQLSRSPKLCTHTLQNWCCNLSIPSFVEASMPPFLFHFQITFSHAIHGGSRMCNKTVLDDLSWTDFCDSIKNSWGSRGLHCGGTGLSLFASFLQVDQRFCDGTAVYSGAFHSWPCWLRHYGQRRKHWE